MEDNKEKQIESGEEILKEEQKTIQESIDIDSIESVAIKNEAEFEWDNIKYRVKPPTQKQKQDIYQKKVEKFSELMSNKHFKLEAKLKAEYKEKGLDIDEIVRKMMQLELKKKNLQGSLGKALEEKASENELELLKNEIKEIDNEVMFLSLTKTNHLQYSIESQSSLYAYQYLTMMVTEKLEGEKWIRAFNTLDEFFEAPEQVIHKASFNATILAGQL